MLLQIALKSLPVPIFVADLTALDAHREKAAQGFHSYGSAFQPEDGPLLFSFGLPPEFDLHFQFFVGDDQFLRSLLDLLFQEVAVFLQTGIHFFKFTVAGF